MDSAQRANRVLLGVHMARAAGRPLVWAWLLAFAGGCVWIDDFDKFKVEKQAADAGPDAASGDASPADASRADASASDAGPSDAAAGDAGEPSDGSAGCKDVDCKALDGPCTHGACNPATGQCEATRIADGQSCFDDNPCTFSERCMAGVCVGQALDCSAFDDECSQGVCDPVSGGCSFGPNRMSQPCDDANPCTLNDRCNSAGICESGSNAAPGSACTDYNSCSGTDAAPDGCDNSGNCMPGGAVAGGTPCNDDNECTTDDACDGAGACGGAATREGQPCNTACSSNTTCQAGSCVPSSGSVPAYDKQCFFHWCDSASLCQTKWKNDRACDCGCPFSDPDCTDCSERMCQSDAARKHPATSWCDQNGKAIGNCPDSLKGDGKCDCGCQFVDPDCSGGSCCGPTGHGGCANSFVENCVCRHESNPEPSCCTGEWTQDCADLAVALGCMVCP
jgi:hypothetical protein